MSVTSAPDGTSADFARCLLEVAHVHEIPPRRARIGAWPDWLPADSSVRSGVERLGIDGLWEHQTAAASALAAGRHVVLTTGTASGKSLAYLLPIAADEISTTGLAPDRRGTTERSPLIEGSVRWRRRPATSLLPGPDQGAGA